MLKRFKISVLNCNIEPYLGMAVVLLTIKLKGAWSRHMIVECSFWANVEFSTASKALLNYVVRTILGQMASL